MQVAALFSGGKDSTYAAKLAEEEGNKVTSLVSMRSTNKDSYMFHTVNQHLTKLQAKAISKHLVIAHTSGIKEKELKDLELVLTKLDIDGVVSGAIASIYQKSRIDQICDSIGIVHLSPLWKRERMSLLLEMLGKGMKIIVSAVAAEGLNQEWLGSALDEDAINRLSNLHEKFGVDICGEGGEYESLVIDAPWFKKRLQIISSDIQWDGMSGRFFVNEARLENKMHKI
jgi:ABC transporter with metal-binding/Fe-S-binding domain ATP-binding protein